MLIKIRGGSKLEKKIIREYGSWLGDKLLGKRLSNVVSVDFIFDETVNKMMLDGMTDWEFPDGNGNPREFTISLNTKLSTNHFIDCIAHEMVHVKQFAKGELKQRKNEMIWMRTERYDTSMMDTTEYHELPWEIEAHGREHGLYVRYLTETKSERFDDGEFLANIYREDGSYVYSCTMKDDGEIKPVAGCKIYTDQHTLSLDPEHIMMRPKTIKKIIFGYEGFRYA